MTGFALHQSETSKFKGVSYINVSRFYIVLRVAGGILFFGMYRSKM
jgi:hypothetical protein